MAASVAIVGEGISGTHKGDFAVQSVKFRAALAEFEYRVDAHSESNLIENVEWDEIFF